ncbi:hypothetical protein BC939DRAFT_480120 [Gamsiella multidivaricata]|uniref:uncharacterized protein n=1 Tax=Gamsiella multidivaricata TaxID=101098 RepID=UPI0022201180|nr:uncharacterized protein BC939DRAFT_480120 [Gamsiella multidivaricata]KAI7818826.1 hypothetical protein BC939DRAFT_480120 [Gamsiella multidivaricata]
MTNTRKSTRSKAAAASASNPEPQPEHSSSNESTPTTTAVDSTHQATETAHAKDDQKLEANDSDLLQTSESLPTEQLSEAATTPINNEVEEEEPMKSTDHHQNEHKESEAEAKGLRGDWLKQANAATMQTESGAHAETTGTASEPGPVPAGGGIEEAQPIHEITATAVDPIAAGPIPIANDKTPQAEMLETNKHAKRAVEQDSNTVAEEEQDYLGGAYKSPFRHTHKAEKAGKEER